MSVKQRWKLLNKIVTYDIYTEEHNGGNLSVSQ